MNKLFLVTIILIFSLGIIGILFAEDFNLNDGIRLNKGENIINTSAEFNPIYASELVRIFPEIATIIYNDSGEEIGYVNVFGGIGDNFIVLPNKTYEITTTKEVILNLG